MKMNKKGFTLIEVLIVVVIIAVLASLILPRFMGQTERAVIAEGQQMLGAIRRGQLNFMDLGGGTALQTITSCGYASCAGNEAQWGAIGMTAPENAKYNFACAGGTTMSCTATRQGSTGGTYDNSVITLYMNGTYGCVSGNYTWAQASDHTRGCTAK